MASPQETRPSSLAPPVRGGSAAPAAETDFATWGTQSRVSANEVLEKEKLVREIIAMQDGLKALLWRVNSVKEDCTKAEADNEMLQTYIDSVTKSLAAKS